MLRRLYVGSHLRGLRCRAITLCSQIRRFSIESTSSGIPLDSVPVAATPDIIDSSAEKNMSVDAQLPPPPPLTRSPEEVNLRVQDGVKRAWRPTGASSSSSSVPSRAETGTDVGVGAGARISGPHPTTGMGGSSGLHQSHRRAQSGLASTSSHIGAAATNTMNAKRITAFMEAFSGPMDAFTQGHITGGNQVQRQGGRGQGQAPANIHAKRTSADIHADIKQQIWRGDLQKSGDKILIAASDAYRRSISLDNKEYLSILWACEQLTGDDDRGELSYWVYSQIKNRGGDIPAEVYSRVAAVCAKRGDTKMALDVLRDIEDKKLVITEKLMSSTVYAVASDTKAPVEVLDAIYKKYIMLSRNGVNHWVGPSAMYTQVAAAYGRYEQPNRVLAVLKQMTEADHEPSINLCTHLLEICLRNGGTHTELLRVLSKWYLQNFKARLDRGVLNRMLQIALVECDDVLAQTSIQLLIRGGYKTNHADYACWLKACIAKKDLVGSVEALISAQAQNIDMLATSATWSGGLDIQQDIAEYLSQSVGMMDNVYFALVDLVRGDYKVPPMMLNAIIMASGYMGLLDRSFATFQEVTSLFGSKTDTNTYNALLWANSKSLIRDIKREEKLQIMFNLLQKMEEEEGGECAPNGHTFEILLDFLSESYSREHHHHVPIPDRNHANLAKYVGMKIDMRPAAVAARLAARENGNDKSNSSSSSSSSSSSGSASTQFEPLPLQVIEPIPGLDGIIDHIISHSMVVKARSLRSLARTIAGSGDIEQTVRVVRLLIDRCGHNNIPKMFHEQMHMYKIDLHAIAMQMKNENLMKEKMQITEAEAEAVEEESANADAEGNKRERERGQL